MTVAAVLGLAIVDSANPSALAVTLYPLMADKNYVPRVVVYVGAVFATYLTIGLLLMLGLTALFSTAEGILHSPAAYGAQAIVGGALLGFAVLAPGNGGKSSGPRLPQSRGLPAIVLLGVTVTVLELPTALPYLAAIGIMTNAGMPFLQWMPALVAYNVIFILPPLLLLGAYMVLGRRFEAQFNRWREKLSGGTREAMLWVLGIVGFLLIADALAYFEVFGLLPTQRAP